MTELLAPAGSYESLIAAVNAGADAVYMGGDKFGARAYADNPERERFIDGLYYAHRYGVKVYMTVNTLFKNDELDSLAEYMKPYYEAGVDAVLVQDLGALSVLKRHFPDLPLHASTQMTVTGSAGAALMKENGIKRIVPARELSLSEITEIKRNVDIEVETFVHGALCYCYSGQCFMSSLIGGRSGNRGRCAQPCRLDYSCESGGNVYEGNLLSMADLCALKHLPELVDAGIDSFKIEGRMKSPRYTAGVVEIWRKYIDLYERLKTANPETAARLYKVSRADTEQLKALFDRGGQTEGYYFRHNGPDMMAWDDKPDRRDNNMLYERLDREYVNAVRKIKLNGRAVIRAGKPMNITAIRSDGLTVSADGAVTEVAQSRSASKEDIIRQLDKTGGTAYEWEDLSVELDEGLFVPVKGLNELRRRVLDELERRTQDEYKRTLQH